MAEEKLRTFLPKKVPFRHVVTADAEGRDRNIINSNFNNKMKKFLLTLALGAGLGVAAQSQSTYTVYNNGEFGPSLSYQDWWKASVNQNATNPTGTTKVLEFRPSDGGTDASCGWLTAGDLNTGKFHNATLNYSWYAEGTGDYTIRLTGGGKEYNYKFSVTADNAGKWNTNSFNVATEFPELATAWDNNANGGTGYIFSIIVANGNDAVIYFDNVYYTGIDDSWTAPVVEVKVPATVPTPTHNAADVASLFSSAYTPVTTFNIGYWGQTTQAEVEKIDGKDVYKLSYFNYLGWELNKNINISDYDYMHVDFWTANQTDFGFTPISPGPKEKGYKVATVKLEEWNSYDVALSEFSDVVDLSDIFQVKFDQGNNVECYIANVYFWKDGNGGGTVDPEPDPTPAVGGATWKESIEGSQSQTMNEEEKSYPYVANFTVVYNEDKTLTVTGEVVWGANGAPVGVSEAMGIYVNNNGNDTTSPKGTITTSETYEAGQEIPVRIYLPIALGVVEPSFTYTVGSSNVATDVPVITAQAQNVTSTSAEIAYEVMLPESLQVEGAVLTVKLDNMPVEASPIVIESLAPSTSYTYTLTASVALDGKTYEAEPVAVTFETLREAGTEVVNSGKVNGTLIGVQLNGQEGTQDLDVTLNYSITCNADNTLTFELVPETEDFNNVVGMVPQLFIEGAYVGNFSQETRSTAYTYTTAESYENGQQLAIGYYCAYAGGATMIDGGNYIVGSGTSTTVVEIPSAENALVDVYTLTGVRVATGVKASEAVQSLNPGLYIIGGKKVLVK